MGKPRTCAAFLLGSDIALSTYMILAVRYQAPALSHYFEVEEGPLLIPPDIHVQIDAVAGHLLKRILMIRALLLFAAVSGFCAVGLGAFAAHGLKAKLDPIMLNAFQTGVHYQMYHALALLGISALLHYQRNVWLIRSGCLFILGTLLFSGSLYLLALGGPRWLGPITPLGGLSFLSGWLCLVAVAWQVKLR